MRTFILTAIFLLLIACSAFAQQREELVLRTDSGNIAGTLTLPLKKTKVPVVLIIAGSGPTDRNGNNPQMVNNSLKMLGDSLVKYGIASLRFDKRGIGESKAAAKDESHVRFSNYIADAAGWLKMLQQDSRFSAVYVAGHSEGSLVGMMAVKQQPVKGYISIAGVSRPADEIIMSQFIKAGRAPQGFLDTVRYFFDTLRNGGSIQHVPAGFYQAFFRPSVQPYMASWMKYNPAKEIATVTIPTLIIQGANDLQVDTAEAYSLKQACSQAELAIIPGMNHIFKNATDDPNTNVATYVNPDMPLNTHFVQTVVAFIKRKSR